MTQIWWPLHNSSWYMPDRHAVQAVRPVVFPKWLGIHNSHILIPYSLLYVPCRQAVKAPPQTSIELQCSLSAHLYALQLATTGLKLTKAGICHMLFVPPLTVIHLKYTIYTDLSVIWNYLQHYLLNLVNNWSNSYNHAAVHHNWDVTCGTPPVHMCNKLN